MCKIQRLIWKLEGLDSPERLYSSQSSWVRSELFVFPGLLLGLWLNNQLWLALQLLPGNDITLLLFLVFVWGREADGWKGLHLCVCTCARSWLTISHPELWQPYSSVVGWQLLLNSDIELQKKGNSQQARSFWLKLIKVCELKIKTVDGMARDAWKALWMYLFLLHLLQESSQILSLKFHSQLLQLQLKLSQLCEHNLIWVWGDLRCSLFCLEERWNDTSFIKNRRFYHKGK